MKNQPVLIVDSGIGGLNLLNRLVSMQPNCDYIYFADSNNLPFGDKPINILRSELIENLKLLNKKYHPQMIVFACNTLTAVSISMIRKIFKDTIIIGTEPALKLAIDNKKKNILLMATPNTIKYSKVLKQFEFNKSVNIIKLPLKGLASNIEKNIDNLGNLRQQLKNTLSNYLPYIDSIVLGCTHYIYLKPYLREICSTDIKIFDGDLGVSNQVLKFLKPKDKIGKIFVLTNKISAGGILISAWNLLQKKGNKLCVE